MINYYLLTKPGIILGNLITVAAGFVLASQGIFDLWLCVATLIGLALVMASGCVFNNYIDRNVDQKMKRTKNRVLVKGLISGRHAVLFAILLGLAGGIVLLFYTNVLTFCIAALGFFVYVVLYSLWKVRTIYATAIGSIAGGIPPLVGYCAVSNRFDVGALLLFAIMVLWQMPHFFAIAMYHYDDYAAASIPVLPIKKGIPQAKRRMILYISGFIVSTLLLTLFHYTGYFYFTVAALLGLTWLLLCIQGFKRKDNKLWARQMFRLSLAVITTICLVIPFDLA